MKYRIIILIIIISSLGQIFLSCIANTSRTHIRSCTRARTHTRVHTRVRTHARTHLYTHRRTGYRYSVAPNRDGPLRLRQCRSLAILINTRSGDQTYPRFWMFFTYNKIARPNWDANSWQDVLSDDTNSYRDISRDDRARIATCSLRTLTDRLKENYSIDCTTDCVLSVLEIYVQYYGTYPSFIM